MKKKIKLVVLAFILSSGLSLSACSTGQTPQARPEIVDSLIKYTDKSSPGPNGNYYYKNGKADLSNLGKLSKGQSSFKKDNQGRASTAKAVLTYSEFKASIGSRQGNPLQPPYYPNNVKVAIQFSMTGKTYHGYLWNKSHSISDSLLGKLSYTSKYNFTAGTRPQNVGADQNGGMRAAEEIAENYWKSHPNTNETISYMVTPVYKGNEKIPRGSIVDEKSSDGVIDVELVIINSVETYSIDYNSGRYTKGKVSSTDKSLAQSQRTVYVASKGNSDAYWYDKRSMPETTNKANVVTMTEAEAIAAGKHHSQSE